MTILHVTDFHFHQPWFTWLSAHAPAHDLLVMSGDMLDLSAPASHEKQIAWVSDWINDYPQPMIVCSGNHDLEWDAEAERWTPAYWLRRLARPAVWVDGQRVTLDGLSVLAISCTTRPKGGEADLWVVHAAPTQTLVATRSSGRDAGDPDLVNPVRRYAPRVVLSGHVHDPLHWCEQKDSTLYLNPGRTPGAPFPNHILLQTEDMSCQLIAATKQEVMRAPAALAAPGVMPVIA
ncbi:MAG: metallophosphoesterase [Lacunisphaera sp.]